MPEIPRHLLSMSSITTLLIKEGNGGGAAIVRSAHVESEDGVEHTCAAGAAQDGSTLDEYLVFERFLC